MEDKNPCADASIMGHAVRAINFPEPSDWQANVAGLNYRPLQGQEPNRFHRWMQRLVLGIKWRKVK